MNRAAEQLLASTVEQRFEREAMPYLRDLIRTATRIIGDCGRAEAVVQDVYLQAWKSFGRFESGTNCRAWLYKILLHCVQHYRRKWFHLAVMQPMDDYTEATAACTPPIPGRLRCRSWCYQLRGRFRNAGRRP